MSPATWWALAFIALCVVLIVWVRVKYPLPASAQQRRGAHRRARTKQRRSNRSSSSKVC